MLTDPLVTNQVRFNGIPVATSNSTEGFLSAEYEGVKNFYELWDEQPKATKVRRLCKSQLERDRPQNLLVTLSCPLENSRVLISKALTVEETTKENAILPKRRVLLLKKTL